MSRFYAEIKGNRGVATRQGYKSSGIWSHTRGWQTGIYVRCFVDKFDRDEIHIYKTGGSGNQTGHKLISILYENGAVEYIGNDDWNKHMNKIVVKQKEDGFTD